LTVHAKVNTFATVKLRYRVDLGRIVGDAQGSIVEPAEPCVTLDA